MPRRRCLLFGLQEERTQGRQRQAQRVRTSVSGLGLSLHPSQIPHAASAVFLSIAVQQLSPESTGRHPHPIRLAWDGSEVAHDYDILGRQSAFAQEGNHAGRSIIAIHAFEGGGLGVDFVQGSLPTIDPVQLLYPALNTAVYRILQYMPL